MMDGNKGIVPESVNFRIIETRVASNQEDKTTKSGDVLSYFEDNSLSIFNIPIVRDDQSPVLVDS